MLICWFIFVEFVDLLKFVEKSTKIKNQQAILKIDQQKQKSTNDFHGFLEPCPGLSFIDFESSGYLSWCKLCDQNNSTHEEL